MKKLLIIFLIIFCEINSFSQVKTLTIEKTVNKYHIDSVVYTVFNFELFNRSSDTFLFWIEKDTVNQLSVDQKVKKYFYTLKGDYSLVNLIYENEIKRMGCPVLFFSFYKIIMANNKFHFTVLKEGEVKDTANFINEIEQHMVIMKKKDSKKLEIIDALEVENYMGNELTILAKFLNL
jgi:hypothetical protein